MKKFATFCFAIALLGVATPAITRAADGEGEKKKRPEMTEEQKKVNKELLEKYDTDKNGWQIRAIAFENWTNGALSRLEILVSRPKIFEFLIDPSAVKTNAVKR